MWTVAAIAIASSIEGAPVPATPVEPADPTTDTRGASEPNEEGSNARGDRRPAVVIDATQHAQARGDATEVWLATPAVPPGRFPKLRRYLARPVASSARFLDHGVIMLGAAGGYPHLYRLAVGIGLLDHVSLGVTAHWLPRESVPRWSPTIALAFFRSPRVEVGMHYFQSLYPPPQRDDDPATLSFQPRVHWILASVSFAQRWVSGGFDGGAVRTLDRHPGKDPDDAGNNAAITRWRIAGGVHLRMGTRRFGFTMQALAPRLYAELVFDVRFGAFEVRPRGGWSPRDILWSTDWRPPRGR